MTRTCPPCNHDCREGRDCPARDLTRMRGWWLEFDSDGQPFTWAGLAYSERGAEGLARTALAAEHPTFNEQGARLVACLER